ncbi:hypothetical protein ES702_02180 [subsurface metagenome]
MPIKYKCPCCGWKGKKRDRRIAPSFKMIVKSCPDCGFCKPRRVEKIEGKWVYVD